MKRNFCLPALVFCMLVFPAGVLKAGIADELAYVSGKSDLYIYINFSEIMGFIGGRGVKLEDIDSMATDCREGEAFQFIKQLGIRPADIGEMIVAMNLRDTQKKSGYLVIINTKKGKGHVPVYSVKNPVKLKSGKAYRISGDGNAVYTKISDFFIIGPPSYLDSFLEKRSRNKSRLSERSKQFGSKLHGKSVYVSFTVTDFFITRMNSVLKSSESGGLGDDVFIRTLTMINSCDLAVELGNKAVFTCNMLGTKNEDAERLFMAAHSWVAGAGMFLSFAGMFPGGKDGASAEDISGDRELLTRLQTAFGRMHVRQVDKGVVATIEMAQDETDAAVAIINREIAKEKKTRSEWKEREKTAKLTGAIKRNNLEAVRKFVKEKYNLDGFDTDGNTPLCTAAFTGNVKIAEFLMDNGAGINISNVDRLMPLHVAVKNEHKEMVLFLLGRGADINAKAGNALTPLHYNAIQGNSEITGILVAGGAMVNARDVDYSTPLHYASSGGFTAVVKVLAEKKADLSARNRDNRRPVDVAARNKRDQVVAFFKSSFGQEPEHMGPEDEEYNEAPGMGDEPDDEIDGEG